MWRLCFKLYKLFSNFVVFDAVRWVLKSRSVFFTFLLFARRFQNRNLNFGFLFCQKRFELFFFFRNVFLDTWDVYERNHSAVYNTIRLHNLTLLITFFNSKAFYIKCDWSCVWELYLRESIGFVNISLSGRFLKHTFVEHLTVMQTLFIPTLCKKRKERKTTFTIVKTNCATIGFMQLVQHNGIYHRRKDFSLWLY